MTNKYAPLIEKLQGQYTDSSARSRVLDEAHLHKIESQLGFALPKDYWEFLRSYGGISFCSAEFPFTKNGWVSEGSVDTFLSSDEESTIADGHREALRDFTPVSSGEGREPYPGIHLIRDAPFPVEEMGWPAELLPIAYDAGGNTICLALSGSRPGAIFYWVFGQDIFLIADSFDEFIHLLGGE